MASGALAGIRVVAFESRRAEEIATLLTRHGADVTSAPALREMRLPESPEALELVARLDRDEVGAVVLLTGVGTRALAAVVGEAGPRLLAALGRVPVVARGPKPLAALRELGVTGAPAAHLARDPQRPRRRRTRTRRPGGGAGVRCDPGHPGPGDRGARPLGPARPGLPLGAARGYRAARAGSRGAGAGRARRRHLHERGAGGAPLPGRAGFRRPPERARANRRGLDRPGVLGGPGGARRAGAARALTDEDGTARGAHGGTRACAGPGTSCIDRQHFCRYSAGDVPASAPAAWAVLLPVRPTRDRQD